MSDVVVRFAPSPTGLFHVGSARTALFNWMWARATGGKFLLRIEDTDTVRSTPESLADILSSLDTLGLNHDGDVYYASEHRADQLDAAALLFKNGLAYYCTCTPEDVKSRGVTRGYDGFCRNAHNPEGSGVLRLRTPSQMVTFEDAVSGPHSMHSDEFGDFPLVKANGDPLFIMENVVDDILMGVNWVIRGADHLTNNARYILVWCALAQSGFANKELPTFAHLPLIMGPSGQKLSKRRDKVALSSFLKDDGILPGALLTYLSSLGWGAPEDHDRDSVAELVKFFDIHSVGVTNAVMDPLKLRAINADQLRLLASKDPVAFSMTVQKHLGVSWDLVKAGLVEAVATRVATLSEVKALVEPVFDDMAPDQKAANKWLVESNLPLLKAFRSDYETLEWTSNALHARAESLAAEYGLGMLKATMPVRVAVLRSDKGLPLFDALEALGREKTLDRIDEAIGSLI